VVVPWRFGKSVDRPSLQRISLMSSRVQVSVLRVGACAFGGGVVAVFAVTWHLLMVPPFASADSRYQDYYCALGGTPCPLKSNTGVCPLPLSDSNYYCGTAVDPTTCFGPASTVCVDDSEALGPPGAHPCGTELTCKTSTPIVGPTGAAIYCLQYPSQCYTKNAGT
jgi:hypothetical protein